MHHMCSTSHSRGNGASGRRCARSQAPCGLEAPCRPPMACATPKPHTRTPSLRLRWRRALLQWATRQGARNLTRSPGTLPYLPLPPSPNRTTRKRLQPKVLRLVPVQRDSGQSFFLFDVCIRPKDLFIRRRSGLTRQGYRLWPRLIPHRTLEARPSAR